LGPIGKHGKWTGLIRKLALGALGAFCASLASYVLICLLSGKHEAWDAPGIYVPSMIGLPAAMGFLWPRLVLVTCPLFVAGQPAASIAWAAARGHTNLAWWPMAVFLTTPLFVMPMVIPSALIGAGLRLLLGRVAAWRESKNGE